MSKPLLKWIGSKTQILSKVLDEFPDEINDYHEPFLGSGSVLIGLLEQMREGGRIKVRGRIYAYDINDTLIYFFKNVQTEPQLLLREIDKLVEVYANLPTSGTIHRKPRNIEEARSCHESYYYWIRGLFNALTVAETRSVLGSAYFLFLNKTCFRGLYRKTQRGGFNVAFGHYKETKKIVDRDHLLQISQLIRDVIFVHSSFEDVFSFILQQGGSHSHSLNFIYLDPPYYPIKDRTFVGYTSCGFDRDQHLLLFEQTKRHGRFLMSNSDCEAVRNEFSSEDYTIQSISCKRRIHPKKPEDMVNELLIRST